MIEFIALHLWQMWAILAVLCLILELTAGDFFIICFSIGAVFACITDAGRRYHPAVGGLCRIHACQPFLCAAFCCPLPAQGGKQSRKQCRRAAGTQGTRSGNHQGRQLRPGTNRR